MWVIFKEQQENFSGVFYVIGKKSCIKIFLFSKASVTLTTLKIALLFGKFQSKNISLSLLVQLQLVALVFSQSLEIIPSTQSLLRKQPVLCRLFVAGNQIWPGEVSYFSYLISFLLFRCLIFSKMRAAILKFSTPKFQLKKFSILVMSSLVFAETKTIF